MPADVDAVFEFGCLRVSWAKLEREIDLSLCSGEIASTQQGNGEVVVIVRVVRVGGGGALKQGHGVVALTAGGDSLIVDDFGKGQPAGNEGEGRFGLSVLCGVEAGEADIEMRFEGSPVGLRDFGKCCCGPSVLLQGEIALLLSPLRCAIGERLHRTPVENSTDTPVRLVKHNRPIHVSEI